MVNRIDRSATLANVQRQDGMLRLQANLTRTGIFKYQNPDGSTRREYRPESEVFSQDSLASFAGRPLTIGHRLDAVDSSTWGEVAVGDVRDDAHREGTFVRATVQVNKADAIRRVDAKDLVEVSCGYRCDLDNTPGSFQGEAYDCIQRNIRLNHVALLPQDHGRAGRDVKLLLDAGIDAAVELPSRSRMTDEEIAKILKERNDALEAQGKAEAKAREAEGKAAAEKAMADQARADAKKNQDGLPALIQARVALEAEAKRVCPDLKCDGKSDAEIEREVVAKLSPTLRVDDAATLHGAFVALVGSWDGGRKQAEVAIAGATVAVQKKDSAVGEPSVIEAARARNYARAKTLFGMTDKDFEKTAIKVRRLSYEASIGVKGDDK